MYCAEYDLGLIPDNDSPKIALQNTARINSAYEHAHKHGNFNFSNSKVFGPIRKDIVFPGGEYFTAGPIITSNRIGQPALIGTGKNHPVTTSNHFTAPKNPDGSLPAIHGGISTKITRIDGQNGGPVVLMRGQGCPIRNINVQGRPYRYDPTAEGPLSPQSLPYAKLTSATRSGIEIESREPPACGYHAIEGVSISYCDVAMRCLPGYYPNPAKPLLPLTHDESHADMSIARDIIVTGCKKGFLTEGQQAIGWYLNNWTFNGQGGAGLMDVDCFDLQRASNIVIDTVWINDFRTLLLNLGKDYFTSSARRLSITNVKWDLANHLVKNGLANILRMERGGQINLSDPTINYSIRITGEYVYALNGLPPIDISKLIDVPDNFNLNDVKFDITGLPLPLQPFISNLSTTWSKS